MVTIQSVDWAIKKPLCIYDGNDIKESHDPKDITADIVLLERGAPYSLIAQIGSKKILMVSGEDTSKFRGGIKKTDREEAIDIWKLYEKNPNLFKEIGQRDISENMLRYDIKMYYSLLKTRIKLNNESKALNREYIMPDIYRAMIDNINNTQKRYKDELVELAKSLYEHEANALVQMKGVGELNASIFVTLVDIRKFENLSKLMMFCGYGHTQDNDHQGNNRYNRTIKNVVGTTCRSILMHKIDPYYEIYTKYKEKKLNEGKKRGHADNLARRKACQRLIKEFRRKLLNVTKNMVMIEGNDDR